MFVVVLACSLWVLNIVDRNAMLLLLQQFKTCKIQFLRDKYLCYIQLQ